MSGRCDSRYSILPFGAIRKICFIFINHIYLTLRLWFHLILINMIYTIEADFRPDTDEKILHLESHRLAILFWRSDCYPATGTKFCAMLVTNYWAHITFAQIYNVMTYALEAVGNFMRSIEKWQIPIDYLVYLKFRTLQLVFFTPNTMHEKGIKVTILGCGWCQAISSKSKCQVRVFPLGFKIFHTFGW